LKVDKKNPFLTFGSVLQTGRVANGEYSECMHACMQAQKCIDGKLGPEIPWLGKTSWWGAAMVQKQSLSDSGTFWDRKIRHRVEELW